MKIVRVHPAASPGREYEPFSPWTPPERISFLDLPLELRLPIYYHALIFPSTIELCPGHGFPALLRLNRQIRTEASPIYWQNNTFELNSSALRRIRKRKVASVIFNFVNAEALLSVPIWPEFAYLNPLSLRNPLPPPFNRRRSYAALAREKIWSFNLGGMSSLKCLTLYVNLAYCNDGKDFVKTWDRWLLDLLPHIERIVVLGEHCWTCWDERRRRVQRTCEHQWWAWERDAAKNPETWVVTSNPLFV